MKQTYKTIDREVLGPTVSETSIRGGTIEVSFKHAGSGLVSDNGEALNWFEISDGTKVDEPFRPNPLRTGVLVQSDRPEYRALSTSPNEATNNG